LICIFYGLHVHVVSINKTLPINNKTHILSISILPLLLSFIIMRKGAKMQDDLFEIPKDLFDIMI